MATEHQKRKMRRIQEGVRRSERSDDGEPGMNSLGEEGIDAPQPGAWHSKTWYRDLYPPLDTSPIEEDG